MNKKKRRFLTIELNPEMTDEQERKFKKSIEEAIENLKYKPKDKGLLIIPKIALKIGASDIVMIKKQIIIPK